MPVTKENVGEVVRYHAPTPEQIEKHERLAIAAEQLIRTILDTCPEKCGDTHAAIRHVREAKMTASAAIALNGLV